MEKKISEDKIKNLKAELRTLIHETVAEVNNEINLHKEGKEAFLNEDILQKIKLQLLEMSNALSMSIYMPNYSYIIRDWGDYSNPMGEKLLGVIHKYQELP